MGQRIRNFCQIGAPNSLNLALALLLSASTLELHDTITQAQVVGRRLAKIQVVKPFSPFMDIKQIAKM
jgi:hypothetical protein